MKRCPDKTEWVLYASEEAPEGRRADLEAHLEGCEACRREVSALRRGLRALTALTRESPVRPEGMETLRRRLRVAAAHRAARPRVIVAVWQYRWAAAAAAVVLAAAAWTLWPAGRPIRAAQDTDISDAIAEITAAVEILETEQYAGGVQNGSSRFEKNSRETDETGRLLEYLSGQGRSQG